MSELPQSAPPPAPAVAPSASSAGSTPPAHEPRASPPAGRRTRRVVVLLLLVTVALLAAGGWWALRTNFDRQQAQLAEAQRQVAAASEQSARIERDLQLKLERLEAELVRQRDQRSELDQLYLDLTRGRDESALLEVERLVTLAAQELQISGSVATALAALQMADARLARIDRPQMVNLRRAIGRDIERLRAAPAIDLTGMALKIDQIAQGVDGWALLAEASVQPAAGAKGNPATQAPAAAPATGVAKAEGKAPVTEADSWWITLRAWLKQEFGDLVRVREVDTPEALLLTASQQQLVRQQMKLRLLNARSALLMRNDRLYRADLAEAQALLTRYFDTRHTATVSAQAQLKQLAAAPLSVDLPQIAETLAAVRGARPQGR
mgnify:CR=1 FL=1